MGYEDLKNKNYLTIDTELSVTDVVSYYGILIMQKSVIIPISNWFHGVKNALGVYVHVCSDNLP